MAPPVIETVETADQDRVAEVMVLAFARDPITRWTFPTPQQYVATFPDFVKTFGGRAFECGTAHAIEDFSGAALWLPPGTEPDEEALGRLLERTVDARKLRVVFDVFQEMSRFHPAEPHWYLPLIGVDPAKQGKGYGAALLGHALEQIDRAGALAYLDATTRASVPLYQRHGFELLGTIEVPPAPPLFPMLRRPPRAAASAAAAAD